MKVDSDAYPMRNRLYRGDLSNLSDDALRVISIDLVNTLKLEQTDNISVSERVVYLSTISAERNARSSSKIASVAIVLALLSCGIATVSLFQ